jgi:hypothetical protein
MRCCGSRGTFRASLLVLDIVDAEGVVEAADCVGDQAGPTSATLHR